MNLSDVFLLPKSKRKSTEKPRTFTNMHYENKVKDTHFKSEFEGLKKLKCNIAK